MKASQGDMGIFDLFGTSELSGVYCIETLIRFLLRRCSSKPYEAHLYCMCEELQVCTCRRLDVSLSNDHKRRVSKTLYDIDFDPRLASSHALTFKSKAIAQQKQLDRTPHPPNSLHLLFDKG